MKSYRFPILLISFSCLNMAFSQEREPSEASKSVVEVEFFAGGGLSFSPLISSALWQKYLPDFSVPSTADGYQQSITSQYENPSFLFSLRKSYRNSFLESSNIRSTAGLVFGTGTGMYSEQNWWRSSTVTIDSFTVVSSGQTYPIDSTTTDLISRNVSAKDFMIGISQHFQTNPAKRFSFHYGIDVLFGFSSDSRVKTFYSKQTSISPAVGTYEIEQYDPYQTTYAEFSGPKYRSVNVQFPLELAMKPFLRKAGWNVLTVGLTVRPAVQWYYLDNEKGTLFSPWFGMVFRAAI